MIQIPRLLLRQFATAVRQSRSPQNSRKPLPPVVIEAEKGRLTLRAQHSDAIISVQVEGEYLPALMCLPARALKEAAGRQGNVTLDQVDDKLILSWAERGKPKQYSTAEQTRMPALASLPSSYVTNPPALLKALDDAIRTAAADGVRFATSKVQLRGNGEIIGTDGRQLLIQSGFQFPWKDDVLVPKVGLFSEVLPFNVPVKVGRTSKYVFVCVGDWTIGLIADTDSRFPKVEQVVPRGIRTTWRLSADDASGLISSIAQLPGGKDEYSPVTVDLNGKALVRAKDREKDQQTELVLEQSRVVGPPVRFCTDRQYLLRAVQLGFREVRIGVPNSPMLCQEGSRRYIWMPVDSGVIPPSPDATRIVVSKDNGKTALARPKRQMASTVRAVPTTIATDVPAPIEGQRTDARGLCKFLFSVLRFCATPCRSTEASASREIHSHQGK